MSNDADATIGRLVAEASRDLSALVQAEIKLAKQELRFSLISGGVGLGMFLAAAFFAVLMIILAAIGFALLLAIWVGPVWAFFIVAGLCLLLLGASVWVGLVLLKKVRVPKATIESAKEFPAAFKRR